MKPYKIIREINVDEYKDKLTLTPELIDLIKHVKVYLVNQKCGHAYLQSQIITIPKFAIENGEDYFLWYLCHEFSHFLDPSKSTHHGKEFYESLETICSGSFQKFEYDYKPKNAPKFLKKGE